MISREFTTCSTNTNSNGKGVNGIPNIVLYFGQYWALFNGSRHALVYLCL